MLVEAVTPPRLLRAIVRFLEADAWRRKLRGTSRAESQLERAMAVAFRRQGGAVIRRLGSLRGEFAEAVRREQWQPIIDAALAATLDTFREPYSRLAAEALASGARAAIADLAVEMSFDLANPRAVAYLREHAAGLVAGITDETRGRLGTLIADSVEAGESYGTLTRRIRDLFADFSRARAHTIAVTETAAAYEAGSRVMVNDLATGGLDMEMSWLIVGDAKVDQACLANAAADWIPASEAFPSGHQHAPAHPRCRCTVLYRMAAAQ